MEVTKWLKPSGKRVTKYGDSASVQAVVNESERRQDSMVHVKAFIVIRVECGFVGVDRPGGARDAPCEATKAAVVDTPGPIVLVQGFSRF